MDNTNNNNEIDALMDALVPTASGFGDCDICRADARRFHSALTALIAERNKLVEDNASQTYKGNSVCYWHDKANAYKATIGSLWEILESAAVRPDGERTITAALTALVAERDEYKARCKAQHEVMADMVGKEREADRDRDLRERLVCAALTGVCADPNMNDPDIARFAGDIADAAVAIADATLAAMRKGATDGK